jgi:hypothetical protein
MEALLTVAELRAIAEQCRAYCVPFARWHMCEGIARGWEGVAVRRLADDLAAGAAKDRLMMAAVTLGLSPDTINRRVERWAAACRDEITLCGPSIADPAGIFDTDAVTARREA